MEHQPWLLRNILMMDEDMFRRTLVRRANEEEESMNGVYRLASLVRMRNFMYWTEEWRQRCIEFGRDLPQPNFVNLENVESWRFNRFRTFSAYHEINVVTAGQYLDRDTEEIPDLCSSFNETLKWFSLDDLHWIAANILDFGTSDELLKEGKVGREPNDELVRRRMRNWIGMHETWRVEFMNLAYVPWTRQTVGWNSVFPATIACLQDAPSFNPDLELTEELAKDYMNRSHPHPFTNQQTEYLYDLWSRKNPKFHNVLEAVVQAERERNLSSMNNWLRMHPGWKEKLYNLYNNNEQGPPAPQ